MTGIDTRAVAALADAVLGPEHKSIPPAAWGATVREFLAAAPALTELSTPLLTLDRSAMAANQALLGEWARSAGVRLAPHGKTTMAPQLWAQQLAAGCWAITLATAWQAQLARAFGVRRIVLANAVLDPVALRWLGAELARDPEFEFCCWVDSPASVALMAEHLADAPAGVRVDVVVELGGPGGRTGLRRVEDAHVVAEAVRREPRLRLAGVGGYEAALANTREPDAVAAVRHYLGELARLHRELAAADAYTGPALVTAGGSAYPDLVIEHLAGLADETGAHGVPTTVVLRSGAYLVHDDGFYAGISPLAGARTAHPLRAAMHGWARVISRPEPGLALLDGGKRDFPHDLGLPVPQGVPGATVSALNDQHAFLRLPDAADLAVGSVVRLGLSHPCTAFDKWRLIPVLDDSAAATPVVVDLVHTFF
ncbi:alanine racemase [Nocardia farcinica]|uniref:D-threonine aldolase n=1 Tax=Nocardia farcinica TaxID=37329 RepID=A0A449GAL4_NOCFR|nr:alanine racemase [Nocardia farcinica]MBA4855940.1 alanine racemase [Nocardia farcinica]MBC9818561.1 alanine racemase [Nocardia farcinica]MBF6253629.1 alanine racemase [Nocardia farcinica]MBF6265814.1 alanine racemase [Nocardia farcinica]MBF6284289.1 alanine racemase [Nocardia farcinica]